jgi:hypothetical protein
VEDFFKLQVKQSNMKTLIVLLLVANIAIAISNHLKLNKMANDNKQRFDEVISAIDSETNRIASVVQEAMDQIANSGMQHDVEEEVLAKLGEVKTKLTGIAANPANPVPSDPTLGTGTDTGTGTNTGLGDGNTGSSAMGSNNVSDNV